MEECARVEAVIAAWEESGVVEPSDLELVRGHCGRCAGCARQFAPLLPLLARDAGTESARAAQSGEVAEAVMARVRFSSPRRRAPRWTWTAAAAACVLLAAGLGFALARGWGGPRPDEVVVHFELEAPGARSVALVGSFTGWDASRLMMNDSDRDGVWQITVRLKKDSVATYNFVIDGTRWVPDPRSPARVDDGFGGQSSVLRL